MTGKFGVTANVCIVFQTTVLEKNIGNLILNEFSRIINLSPHKNILIGKFHAATFPLYYVFCHTFLVYLKFLIKGNYHISALDKSSLKYLIAYLKEGKSSDIISWKI